MSLFDRSYSEKRNFIRMKVSTPITLQHGGNHYTGLCQDLSADGLSVDCDESFHLGDELQVSIEQQGDGRQAFNAVTEVARIQTNEANGYNLGLVIKKILD